MSAAAVALLLAHPPHVLPHCHCCHCSISTPSSPRLPTPSPPPPPAPPPLLARRSRRHGVRRRRCCAGASPEPNTGRGASGVVVGQNDLLVVGPGVLGRLVADMWKQAMSSSRNFWSCNCSFASRSMLDEFGEHPGCKVFGQTATTEHHDELTKCGIIPSLKGSIMGLKSPYVIFCAPPSRSDDYPGDLRGVDDDVFRDDPFDEDPKDPDLEADPEDNLDEEDCTCVPIGRSPRTDVLLKAENVVLEAGGCVLRLVGLYFVTVQWTEMIQYFLDLPHKSDRGPHIYWSSKGTVDARPDYILNLIHYEDAASLAIAIMKKRLRGQIFVGCDNEPLSRQEIMDHVNMSGKFDTKFHGFTGLMVRWGKRMENSKTRAETGWQPKYPSFREFLGTFIKAENPSL
ncbi:hypothetical protein ACP4OV_020552 [Aristida adscensionis]